jgi:hypothetical protein
MVSIIAVISMVCVSIIAVAYFLRGRKRVVSYLDNVSVSRQWLMQHQADDRS